MLLVHSDPVRADPGTLCQEKFQNAPAGGAWQDNDLARGITCASLAPNGYTKNVTDFPRRWKSNTDAPGGGGGHHGNGKNKRGQVTTIMIPIMLTTTIIENAGVNANDNRPGSSSPREKPMETQRPVFPLFL